DRHRAAYADDTSWTSTNVDGSKLLDGWDGWAGGLRTSYWGFDETALPIQGRVWAPQGVGPFPLILIVHGNHAMEDFSDAGYAYLGEHFASHGYITVSVDENFLNGTNSSMVKPIGDSGLQEENDARGWLLLEHLKQWTEWSQQSGHPFEGRVDLDKIGLIGHSRGGEAVAIAAAFNELGAYPDDATLAFDYGFNIGAVIAIAPVDGQYEPRNQKHPLTDINYLVVHGSMDGDVISFMGSSQYSRIDFSGDEFRFKSSLYIEGANHGQFNTSWGNSDRSFPFDLFLNKKAIMPAEDQMQIARVYFTAFLDEALKGSATYRPIFADPSKARRWISDNYLIANYEDSNFTLLANFEEDLDPTTGSRDDIKISSDALTKWYEEDAKLKWNPIDSQAVLLAWDDDVHQNKPVYRLAAPEIFPVTEGSTALTFSVSQADTSTKPKSWEPPDGNEADEPEDEDAKDALLDWSLILADTGGREARLALSSHGLLPPQVASNVSKAKSLSSWDDKEVVMRRYTLPISDFKTEEVGFDREQIREIRFEFDRSPRGAIFIDDIGFTDVLTGN
ncbi:MAG: MFS transporter, partial [Pseudomonadota bacterium]